MNVYQQTYKEEFIKELPVDFNKIKNMDLTTMPEHFRALFTTDWNWGIHSKMRMEDRMFLQDLFHDYNRWDVQQKLNKRKPVKEETIVGFVD